MSIRIIFKMFMFYHEIVQNNWGTNHAIPRAIAGHQPEISTNYVFYSDPVTSIFVAQSVGSLRATSQLLDTKRSFGRSKPVKLTCLDSSLDFQDVPTIHKNHCFGTSFAVYVLQST